MTIDLTAIIQAVIALIAAIITAKVIPWIKSKTTNEQQKYIDSAVKVAVFAAEQLYGAGNGKAKLDHVIATLAQKGIDVDREEIEATIKENYAALHSAKPSKQEGE